MATEETIAGGDEDIPTVTPKLSFEDDDSLSVTSVIEARLQTVFQFAGITLQPSLAGSYFHEFADDARDIDYSYLGAEGGGG